MAPRTRSGKGLTIEEVAAHRKAMRAGPVNTTGFPGLPTELLLEIVSHLPTVPFPCFIQCPLDKTYLQRAQVIRTLSQMCKSLRGIFLPLAYERIEVCALPDIEPGQTSNFVGRSWRAKRLAAQSRGKILATELIRQLETVTIRDSTLAQYVKIVNVILPRYSEDAVIEEFFCCLPKLNNVHTIQLLSARSSSPYTLNATKFAKLRFPSVERLFLASYAQAALELFPNIKGFGAPNADWLLESTLLRSSQARLLVQDFRGLEWVAHQQYLFGHRNAIQILARLFPQLQVLRFGICGRNSSEEITSDEVESASQIKELQSIVFHLRDTFVRRRKMTAQKSTFGTKLDPWKPQTINLLVTALHVLQAKQQDDKIRRYIRMLSSHGHTVFALRVLQDEYVCEVDELGLLPHFQATKHYKASNIV